MTRAIWVLLALATGASADKVTTPAPPITPSITPPGGWTYDAERSALPPMSRFGGATTKVTVQAFRPPVGATLFVTRAEAEIPADRRDALATEELDELRKAMLRQGANAKAESSMQRVDHATKSLEAALTWRDPSVGILDASRIVIAADAKRVVVVTGQCVMAIDLPAAIHAACEASLATLDPQIPVVERVALSIVGGDTSSVATPAPQPTTGGPDAHARLDDGNRKGFGPIVVAPVTQEIDRRPVYIGGGLVVFAALFWWNRKRRERFDSDAPSDDAAALLHAAAADVPGDEAATGEGRGDAKKDAP